MHRFLFILFLICITEQAFGEKVDIPASFPVSSFRSKEYNADFQCFDVSQTASGLILVGNVDGLLVFDGSEWELYRMPNNNIVRSVSSAGDTIFVGGWGDFGYFVPDSARGLRYYSLLPSSGMADWEIGDVWNIYTDSDTAYFLTYHYVFRYTPDKKIVRLCQKNQQGMYSVFDKGSIYIPDDNVGLIRTGRNQSYSVVPGGNFFQHKAISCILPIQDKLLLISRNGQVYSYSNGLTETLHWPCSDYLKILKVTRGVVISDSLYALCTSGSGIIFINAKGSAVSMVDKSNGLISNSVKTCWLDHQMGLWVSSVEGISRIETGSGLKTMNNLAGIEGVFSDITFKDGFWYVSTSTGLYILHIHDFIPFRYSKPRFQKIEQINFMSFDLLNTPHGVFCATKEGIFRIEKNCAELIYNFGAQLMLYLPKYDAILTGGWNGIGVINCKNNRITPIERLDSVMEYITAFEIVDSTTVFCNTSSGYLLKIEFDSIDEHKLQIKSIAKYQYNEVLKDAEVNGLAAIAGEMFLSDFNGIYSFKDDPLHLSKLDIPIKNRGIASIHSTFTSSIIAVDNEKNIYQISSVKNSYSIDEKVFSRIKTRKFNSVCNIAHHWFFVDNEGIQLIPEEISKSSEPTTCLIREISFMQDSVIYRGYGPLPVNIDLKYSKRPVRFKFSCPAYNDLKGNRYSYLLEGIDTKWSNYSVNNEVLFTNLREGTYCFKVKSKDINNDESKELSFSFSIHAPWYRTTWAYLGYIIISVLLIITVTYSYNKKLIREKIKLDMLVKQRTRELEEQKEEIIEKNEELKQQNEEILAQRDEIDGQKRIIEQKNNILIESITYAHSIQQAILPTNEELDACFKESFTIYLPKDVVGGDFYWITRNDSAIYCAVADCTGHGVPGGFLSMLGIAFLTEIHSRMPDLSPAERLQQLRSRIIHSLHQDNPSVDSKDGVEISLFSLNLNTLMLEYAISFGKMIVVRDKKAIRLYGDKATVGVSYSRTEVFNNYRMQLQKDDMIYCLTDGYTDQLNRKSFLKLGTRKFSEIAERISNHPLPDQKEKLIEIFEEWKGTREQVDDVLVLGIRI